MHKVRVIVSIKIYVLLWGPSGENRTSASGYVYFRILISVTE